MTQLLSEENYTGNDRKAPKARKRPGRPTMYDVADRVGVSAMTVSRVINGNRRVDEDIRMRVLAAVQSLGYRANHAARSLKVGDQVRMGLIYANPSSAYQMTEHLVALGHKRIGFIAGDPRHSATDLRLEGYLGALADSGLYPFPELIVPGQFTYRSGLDAAEQLLDLGMRPTAIFASNDDMAAACITIAHQRGLHVPKDLSVCGFDDTALATAIWPELTTVRQPISDMSAAAVQLLARTIRDGSSGRSKNGQLHLKLGFEIKIRDSAGQVS